MSGPGLPLERQLRMWVADPEASTRNERVHSEQRCTGTRLPLALCARSTRARERARAKDIDKDIDAANSRTAQIREIPNGSIKANSALIFVIINSLLFILITYLINSLCLALSPIALLVILGYSYTKRITALCHLILGLGLALAPIGAYLAVSGVFAITPLLFSAAVLFWVSGFDIIYSLQDEEFDKQQKLYSIPVLIGKKNAINLSNFFHFLTFIALAFAGNLGDFDNLYWIGLSIFSFLLVYQHTLVKHNDLSKLNLAFFTTNGIASIIFGLFVIADLLIK